MITRADETQTINRNDVITKQDEVITRMEEQIAERIGPQRYAIWFKKSTSLDLSADGEFLRVSTPNHFVGEWIERHFTEELITAAEAITGRKPLLSFSTDPNLARGLARKQPDRQAEYVTANPERQARELQRSGTGLPAAVELKKHFEEFVVGPSNQLAFAAAHAVMDNPAAHYNPLFIHGGCGVGKTHLAQAICNGLKERHPNKRWRYVSGEEFTNDYVYAVRAREMDAFHERYRRLDLLVIDDVHFLANKRATQEEFLHTVKAIDVAGRQLVLVSDTHPKLIGHFSESLVSRFLSGMVVRIESPDIEVRAGVLRRHAARMRADISDPVIQYVAENFTANIRELEGALVKITAMAHVLKRPITLPLAEQAIRDLIRQTAPVVMLSDIESVVAIYFGLTPADLHTSRKSRTIALARGIAMYLARKHTDMSFPEIGRFMGNKNHSTVILATRRISKMLQENAAVSWLTPEGLREQNLATLMDELQDQVCTTRAADAA